MTQEKIDATFDMYLELRNELYAYQEKHKGLSLGLHLLLIYLEWRTSVWCNKSIDSLTHSIRIKS